MTWKYLEVLNVCIQILLTVGLGCLFQYGRIVHSPTFVPQANRFVFYVALPCHVLKAIGIEMDLYDDALMWNYIGAFFLLRAAALVAVLAWVPLATARRRAGGPSDATTTTTAVGQVAVQWLALTWISTVILGVPIAGAVFGDPSLGLQYGVLAAISSFLFQLPLQLFLFECHALQREECSRSKAADGTTAATAAAAAVAAGPIGNEDRVHEAAAPCDSTKKDVEEGADDGSFDDVALDSSPPAPPSAEDTGSESDPQARTAPTTQVEAAPDGAALADGATPGWRAAYVMRGDVWRKICLQLLRNPIIWAIVAGFALSLSTAGPRYLDPKSDDYVPGLGWFNLTLTWLGACVSPLALFAMGAWLQAEWRPLFGCGAGAFASYSSMAFSVTCKLVLVPLVMVGLAKAVGLDDQAGRAAVLMAALPISLASFSLANRYKAGEAFLSENVALGTALILPTVLLWNLVMDDLDLFPLASST